MNFIVERVFVETPVDTDGDGKYDLIAVYIKRPEPTSNGEKVPAVYVANPYMMTCNEDWYVPHDVDQEVNVFGNQNILEKDIKFDFEAERIPRIVEHRVTAGYADCATFDEEINFECISEIYDHFNQRGYASVFSAGLGTKDSEGFTISGSREEILAFKSVIDWLNGRCRAFTNKTDNIEVKAEWCNGNVAMSAKSYLGTMCIGVAATGVEGLKTVIPEAGIVNWYDYYRCNGLNLPALGWQGDDLDILSKYCFSRAKDPEDYAKVKDAYQKVLDQLVKEEDRESANYNRFWDERNYLNLIDQIKASVLIIHGINDWNVKTNQCIPLFQALESHQIPRKMILHQGGHIYIYRLKQSGIVEILDKWLDHYLKGVDNGIEKEEKVLVESNINQELWQASDSWPPMGWKYHEFPIDSHGPVVINDDLSTTVFDATKNNLKEWLDELVLDAEQINKNRAKFVWDVFDHLDCEDSQLRVSGTCKIEFDAAIDQPTAILSAMLVDLGTDYRLTDEEVSIENGQFIFGTEKEPSSYKVITRGWLNAQNRNSIWSKEEIEPNQYHHYCFDMVPTDHTVKKGHQLALILYGIDAEATQRPSTVTQITIKAHSIKMNVPIVKH